MLGVMSLLVVTLRNGSRLEVPSDTSWHANTGPLLLSKIYNGEKYDSTLEADLLGWSTGSYNSSAWLDVKQLDRLKGTLMPSDGPPMKRTEEVLPQRIFTSPANKTLIDFSQNLVGWVRLSVAGPQGTNITLHHAEVLENGELSLRPLRRAAATDSLVLHGNGTQTWEPRFTFHGFRYIQVDGWPSSTPLDKSSLRAVVVHTDMERTGWFECSNPLLTKFHQNVVWSMKGNFLSLPTDCPQRDERLGWTGDAHLFAPTANYLYDTAGFWRGWHRDIWAEMQREDTMVVPFFVPVIPPTIDRTKWNPSKPSAVWGDVAVGGPFSHFQAYGDVEMLREQYAQAQAWVDTGVPRDPSGLWSRSSYQFGDWLDPKAPANNPEQSTTHKYLIADAYLVRMTEYLAYLSQALGYQDAAGKYTTQRETLAQEFRKAWMPDGSMVNRTQTAYALGLQFNLFNKTEEAGAADTLRDKISTNNHLVGTGFAGTPPLGFALARVNATEDFYSMLLQTQVPSWLYQVVQNGTTTWERWDSLLPNGQVNPGKMTSFNHYAFGSVADWIHQFIGGLAPAEPGWRRITVAPVPGGDITSANARHLTPYGEVRSEWSLQGSRFNLRVQVPANTRATVVMPFSKAITEVGSGKYEFEDVKK